MNKIIIIKGGMIIYGKKKYLQKIQTSQHS